MSGSNGLQVETVQAKLQQINQQHEDRAVILYNGFWYLYADQSVDRLYDYTEDYKKFISHCHSPCGFQGVGHIPSKKECKKLYTTSQYIYSPHANCLYYYNHATQNLKAINTTFGRPDAPYEPLKVVNFLLYGDVYGSGQRLATLPIGTLSPDQLAYITYNTGHSQTEYYRLTPRQETCFNNRINNEKVGSTIGWSSLGIGVGSMGAGGLLGGFVFANLIASSFPPAIIGLWFAAGALLLGFLAVQLIGHIYAYATDKYKPITNIIHELPDDSPRNTANIMNEFGLDGSINTIDLERHLEKEVIVEVKQKTVLEFNLNTNNVKRNVKGSNDDSNVTYQRKNTKK